ncbi:MAG: hypothetical protein DRG30_01375, partial [Epsilonproteobacteria bacterium]
MTKIQLSFVTIAILTTSSLMAATTVAINAPTESYSLADDPNLMITTSNQSSETIKNTTADISVLTAADLEESGDQTVAQAISRVAGISVSSNGGLGQPSAIFMRGQSAGSVLILLDGMRLNDPSSTDGRAMIENLMIDNIAQIEIVKGGGSSIWGGNASAGVINIITKSAKKKGFHGNLQLNGGTYNTKGANASLSYGGEKLTAQILASYLDSDSFSALAPRDAENDAYNNKMLNFKIGYAFDVNNALDFSYYLVDTKGDYDDSYSEFLADDLYSHYDSRQENYNLKYHFNHELFDSVNRASRGTFERDYFTNSYGEAQNQYRSTIKEFSSINAYSHKKGKIILGLEAKNIDGMNNYISDYPSDPSQSIYKNR